MSNLIKLSGRSHGVISNLLLRLNPSSSSSSIPASIQTPSPTPTPTPIPNPRPHHLSQNLNPFSIINPNSRSSITIHGGSFATQFLRFYSSESTPNPNPNPNPNPSDSKNTNETPEFKHQEIEGPTVERDLSPLAEEAREVSLRLMKTMYDVSRVLAILGLSQLALGAWISHASSSSPASAVTSMSVVAFALPFSMAFMLRRSLKQMHFFDKMEKIGRLQILTSTMQISKQVHLFFVRLRAVSYFCLLGLPLPIILHLLSSSS